jgi:hypothetical protein
MIGASIVSRLTSHSHTPKLNESMDGMGLAGGGVPQLYHSQPVRWGNNERVDHSLSLRCGEVHAGSIELWSDDDNHAPPTTSTTVIVSHTRFHP